jgi:glycosyltransferase involved in cell wall biosynthesis
LEIGMTVLTVANPFFGMGRASGTGSEWVAATLERAIVERGWKSSVIAAAGSKTAGRLVAVLPVDTRLARPEYESEIAKVRSRLLEAASAADIIHFHSVGFGMYLPIEKARIIVTIHAPRTYYPQGAFAVPSVRFISVSRHQAKSLADVRGLQVIENGVDVGLYRPRSGKRDQLVFVGRICPEKGVDIALRVAHASGLPLTIAGPLPGFRVHQEYFKRAVAPLLDEKRRYVGPIPTEEKIALLNTARCILLPSRWQETSSLVAMEAISCGVPVVASRSGALPEVVEHGITGILAGSEEEMVRAVGLTADISPAVCRARAEVRFDSRRMAREYLACYQSALRYGN